MKKLPIPTNMTDYLALRITKYVQHNAGSFHVFPIKNNKCNIAKIIDIDISDLEGSLEMQSFTLVYFSYPNRLLFEELRYNGFQI